MGTGIAAITFRLALTGAIRAPDRAAHRASAPSLSDEELACRAQQGCADSFEQLMRRFQAPVLHFLRRRGAAAEAEDLLQETFLRAYAGLHQYRSRWRFATWLFTIARRVNVTYHRLPPRPEGREAALALSESGWLGPVEAALQEDSRRYLWARAKQVLSEEEATALWLHYGEDLSTRDIAAVLGRSREAVKAMLFRSRKRLLPLLEELMPDGADGGCGKQKNTLSVADVEADHA
jgi:RNA polymerase sigma-70 factor (ECF subfamily)